MNRAQEMVDEERNVLAALAQRRHREMNHVDPVEQVLPELPLRDQLLEVPVRRGHHPDVGGHRATRSAPTF